LIRGLGQYIGYNKKERLEQDRREKEGPSGEKEKRKKEKVYERERGHPRPINGNYEG
jgi:hypothetical protein